MNDNDQTLTELENPIFFTKVKGGRSGSIKMIVPQLICSMSAQ